MTSTISKTQISSWLQPIASRKNLKNPIISITGSSEKGDGYLGDITFVKVQEESGKTFGFVVKSGKNNTTLRQQFPIRNSFLNEIFIYKKLFPEYLDFQKEKNVECVFDNLAKCYETRIDEKMEVVVLENMKDAGYFLWDRNVGMNREHVVEILKNYGKLHAISFALKDQKPELFCDLVSHLKDIFVEVFQNLKNTEKGIFKDVTDLAKTKGFDDIVEKAMILDQQRSEIHLNPDTKNPYAVIVHGDCWNNNFMFKYKVKKQLTNNSFYNTKKITG